MTRHAFIHGDARNLASVGDERVHLVVTSPPYPMIAMWDPVFCEMDPAISAALDVRATETRGPDESGVGADFRRGEPSTAGDSVPPGEAAFQAMHRQLDRAWAECRRVLVPGGFLCVNIGDATRTLGGRFRLYPNHARIIAAAEMLGFTNLPSVIWRKPTNAPTKFMGSGMLPAGAYVTLEHEHILVFRKGGKRRDLDPGERRRSAIFWEERNAWFSDLWQLTGTRQAVSRAASGRAAASGGAAEPRGEAGSVRSAAFPLEIAFRLILMYSAYGDTILDPFAGTGTTLATAAALGRNSTVLDTDAAAVAAAAQAVPLLFQAAIARARRRLATHEEFVTERGVESFKYLNPGLGIPVMTNQEREMELYAASVLREVGSGVFEAE